MELDYNDPTAVTETLRATLMTMDHADAVDLIMPWLSGPVRAAILREMEEYMQ